MNPELSLFMLLGGVMLAYVEFLKPGWVWPGVAGGVAIVYSLAKLSGLGMEGVRLALADASPVFWMLVIALAAATIILLRIAVRARRNKLAL